LVEFLREWKEVVFCFSPMIDVYFAFYGVQNEFKTAKSAVSHH